MPDDEQHRRQEVRAERERMFAHSSIFQRPSARTGHDTRLAEILESLERGIDAREAEA
jgi:hypothetical protein